jgi:hypothetical protein
MFSLTRSGFAFTSGTVRKSGIEKTRNQIALKRNTALTFNASSRGMPNQGVSVCTNPTREIK